jgi:GNAT superfamily N-acetyltransferase
MQLRKARPDDYAHFVRLFPELNTGDPMRSAEHFVADLMPTMLVAERDGEVDAYCYFQLLRDTAYVRHLVVAPSARRSGLGKKLLHEVLACGRANGCTTFCLNCLPDNAPAIALYEGFGMHATYTMFVLRIPWAANALTGDAPSSARAMTPSDDAALETRFAIVPGLLADARARGRVCVVIEEDGAQVAAAAFDPTYPGAPVFRAARADLAVPLVRVLRSHKKPEHDWVQILVEGQEEIATALLDAGAREHLRTLHFRMSI